MLGQSEPWTPSPALCSQLSKEKAESEKSKLSEVGSAQNHLETEFTWAGIAFSN